MPQYVGYDPWHDAAQYGAGLGQSLTQAFQQMPQQRLQLAMGLAQAKAQQNALGAQLQRQQMMEQQNEQLRQVQMQEARARTAAAQAQFQKTTTPPPLKPKDTIELVTGEDKVPIGVFDYTTKQYTPFGGGNSGGGLGATPSKRMDENQQIENYGKLFSSYTGALANGFNTNQPAMFNTLSNVVARLGQNILAPRTNSVPAAFGLTPTNQPPQLGATNAAPTVRRWNPVTNQLE
jgi:hypothetical protein